MNRVTVARELLEISRSVPEDEWAKLPEDGAENVGRHLNGKRA